MPGDVIGTQIALGFTVGATLTDIEATFGANNASGAITDESDLYTLSLYLNDGMADPSGSGLLEPGTLIYQTTASATDAGGIYTLTFITPVSVPQNFMLALSSSHPTNTWGGSAGLVGPLTTTSAPTIGFAQNTLWYSSTAAGGWQTDSAWAQADGAATNYLALQINAVPEPGAAYLVVGALAASSTRRWQRPPRPRRG